MTILGRLICFFPAVHALSIFLAIAAFIRTPTLLSALTIFVATYGLPLVAYHLHSFFHPLKDGASDISVKAYSPWWGTYQLQSLFIAWPGLESLLRVIPGAFSLWLRLWGSQIGKGVVWTPAVEIADRGLLNVGDHVVFGHESKCISHVISPSKDGRLLLFVGTIKIGHAVMIGAGSRIGPGVEIEDEVKLKLLTDIYPRVKVKRGHVSHDREVIRLGE